MMKQSSEENSSLKSQLIRSNSKSIFAFYLTLSLLLSNASESLPLTYIPTTSKPSTTFDGVTQEKYVNYLKLDGTHSVELPIDSIKIGQNQEYTIMLWMKPNSDKWNQDYQYAFDIQSSLQCFFTPSASLMCESVQQCEKLQVDTSNIGQNQWVHLTVVGSPKVGSTLLLENNAQTLTMDTASYVVLQQTDSSWKICIGGCSGLYGFSGGIREFIFANSYVTPDTAKRIKNHYLLWDNSIIAYYRFAETDFLKNEYKNQYATVSYLQNSSKAIKQRDLIPNDVCFPFNDTKQFYAFNSGSQDVTTVTIDGRWTPSDNKWGYTLSVWVRIDSSSCVNSSPSDAKNNCFLAYLQDAFLLFMPKKNQVAIYFFNNKPYYETLSNYLFVPEKSWVNIQFAADRNTGYDFRIYDILGRLMSQSSVQKDLQTQNVVSKKLSLFKNFKGLVKGLIIYTERKHIPLQMPSVNMTRAQYVQSDSCLVYYKFSADSIYGQNIQGYCQHSKNGLLNAQISASPLVWTGMYDNEIIYNSGSTVGLMTSSQKLFDGIACNDNKKVNSFDNSQSYMRTITQKQTNNMTSGTVEFWFRGLSQNVNYLFSLSGNGTNAEYFSIYYDSAKSSLLCLPFGPLSAVQLYYADYSEPLRKSGWIHLSCMYDQVSENSVSGYLLTSSSQEYNYTLKILNTNLTIPNNTYYVFIGNNRGLKNGSALLRMREVRLWASLKDISEIRSWRFRQLDPRSFATTLLTYLRMNEAGYDDYNFASVNLNSSLSVSVSGITYLTDSDLVICPINTYRGSNSQLCYQDPIDLLVPTVYILKDTEENSNYYYVFDSNSTIFVNPTYKQEVQVSWQFEDPIVNAISSQQSTDDIILKVPVKAVRQDSPYKVRVNYTNTDVTFNQFKDFTFIPICNYYVVNGYTAHSFFYNYTNPTNTEDIKFSFTPLTTDTICPISSFYNQLVQQIDYQFVPPLTTNVNLNFTYNEDGTVTVTIPQRQQFYIPVQTDQKIVFNLYWTNKNYGNLITPTQYLFQNIIFTLRFNILGSTVIPNLKVNQTYALKEQAIAFNATDSYISSVAEAEKRSNLTYRWMCPLGLSALCVNKSGPILNVSTSDYIEQNGTYNKSVSFSVNIIWTRLLNGTQVNETFSVSQSVVFYDAVVPTLTIYTPTTVKSTIDDQKFQVTVNNYDILQIQRLNIQWSIVPNLTISGNLNVTQNGTLLTVPAGGFKALTNYTITITVTHKNYSQATSSKSVTFQTATPPFGGTIYYTPTVGYVSTTNFTFTLKNWQSNYPPVIYRVYSTGTPGGTSKLQLLSSGWINATQNLTIKATNTNPFWFDVSDSNGEIVIVKANPTVTYSSTTTQGATLSSTSLKTKLQSLNILSDKYSFMASFMQSLSDLTGNDLSKTLTPSETSTQTSTQTNSTPSQDDQTYSKEAIIDQILKDTQVISLQKSIDSGESSVIIYNSVQMIEQMTDNPKQLNDYIAINGISILQSIQQVESVFVGLLKSDDLFKSNFIESLSNLYSYTDYRIKSLSSNRRLYDTSTVAGVESMISDIQSLQEQLVSQLCSITTKDTIQQSYQTQSFNLLIERFSTQASVQIRSFLNVDDQKSRINLNQIKMMKDLEELDQNIESACVYTIFYKTNITIIADSNLNQESESLIQFGIDQYQSFNPQYLIDVYFALDPDTFKNNQTSCMGFRNSNQKWDENICQTTIDTENLQVECSCNMIDLLYLGLITDLDKQEGEHLNITYKNISNGISQLLMTETKQNDHFNMCGTITVIGIGIFIGGLLTIMNDGISKKFIDKHIKTKYHVQTLYAFSSITKLPIQYLVHKSEYLLQNLHSNQLHFMDKIIRSHPLMTILIYDPLLPRFFKLSVAVLQVNLFTIIPILVFGYTDSKYDSNGNMLIVGLIGMIMTLPFPCIKEIMKAKLTSSDQVRIQNEHQVELDKTSFQCTSNELRLGHRTVYQDLNQEQPVQNNHQPVNADCNEKNVVICPEALDLYKNTHINTKLSKISLVFRIIIPILNLTLFILIIYLQAIIDDTISKNNQKNIGFSFMIAYFGGYFILNFIRSFIVIFIFNTVIINKKLQWMKMFIDFDLLQAYEDFKYVKQVQKMVDDQIKQNEQAMGTNSSHRIEQPSDYALNRDESNFNSNLNEIDVDLNQKHVNSKHYKSVTKKTAECDNIFEEDIPSLAQSQQINEEQKGRNSLNEIKIGGKKRKSGLKKKAKELKIAE